MDGGTFTGRVKFEAGIEATDVVDITQRVDSGEFQYYQTNKARGWPEDSNSWAHLHSNTHSNQGNYYAMQMAGGYFDNDHFYVRKTNNNGNQPWRELVHTGNVSQEVSAINNVTIIPELSDIKKRLDQPWGNPVTYYGAVSSQTQDSSAAFNVAASTGTINIPPGDFVIDNPIVSNRPLVVQGSGPYDGGSRLLARAPGLNMFQHDLLGSTPGYFDTFMMSNLGLFVTGVGPQLAVDIRQREDSGQFIMNDVKFGSFSGDYHWPKFVHARGTTYSKFNRVNSSGNAFNAPDYQANQTQIGFHFESSDNNNRIYGIVFDNCDISAILHGIFCEISGPPGNSGSIEGLIIRDCFGRSLKGPWFRQYVPQSSEVWSPPYYCFERFNYEGPGTACDIDSASEVNFTGCLFYGNGHQAGVDVDDFIRVRNSENFRFRDNSIILHDGISQYLGNTSYKYILSISGKSDGVWIRDNMFRPEGNSEY